MTTGVRDSNHVVTAAAVVGFATLVVAVAWRSAFQSWATVTGPPRFDIFEPFLHPWEGLTWLTQAALWFALLIRPWPWVPLTAVGILCVGIQARMGVGSAWLGIADGHISPLGGLMGVLSMAQIGLTVTWIVLIARSKRMQP